MVQPLQQQWVKTEDADTRHRQVTCSSYDKKKNLYLRYREGHCVEVKIHHPVLMYVTQRMILHSVDFVCTILICYIHVLLFHVSCHLYL